MRGVRRTRKMAAISVTVNGATLNTVSTDARNVVAVHIHGDLVGPELAHINATGGSYGKSDGTDHRIFIEDLEIKESDEIVISLLEKGIDCPIGKTIEELHPGDGAGSKTWQLEDKVWNDLRRKRQMRRGFWLELIKPDGEAVVAQTTPESYMFGLNVVWNWTRPDSARVSLSSASIDSIESRQDGTQYTSFRIQFGQSVRFVVKQLS